MSLVPPRCTCDERDHACSPPCPAHPEKGGGLGNPGWDKDDFWNAMKDEVKKFEDDLRQLAKT